MTNEPVSRRAFFGQMASGCGLGLAANLSAPDKAWFIVTLSWEHNDEGAFCEGECPQREVYYDRAAVDAECSRLIECFSPRKRRPSSRSTGCTTSRAASKTKRR